MARRNHRGMALARSESAWTGAPDRHAAGRPRAAVEKPPARPAGDDQMNRVKTRARHGIETDWSVRARSVGLSRRLPAALLAAMLTLCLAGAETSAAEKVLINFAPAASDLDTDYINGDPVAFKDSAIVQRLADANDDMDAEMIAAKMMPAIVDAVKNIYMGINVTFTTDPTEEGINRTIHIVAGATDKENALGFVRTGQSLKGFVMLESYEKKNVFIEPDQARPLTQAEAINAIGKTAAHELGHIYGLPDVNTMRQTHKPMEGEQIPDGANPAIKPASGTMAQGVSTEKTPFKDAHKKKLTEDLAKDREKDQTTVGEADKFGSVPPEERNGFEDVITPQTILPSEIGLFTGPGPGFTNQMLPFALHQWQLTLPPTFDAFAMTSVFLEIRFYNVTPGAIKCVFADEMDLLVGTMNEFFMLDQSGGEFGAVLVDLEEFAPLPVIQNMLSDNTLNLAICGGGFAIDYIRLTAYSESAPPCPWDVSGSGTVGSADLGFLLGCWGVYAPGDPCEAADFTGSGTIGSADLAVMLGNWGPCP